MESIISMVSANNRCVLLPSFQQILHPVNFGAAISRKKNRARDKPIFAHSNARKFMGVNYKNLIVKKLEKNINLDQFKEIP